jgi:hypothetical protein
LKAVTKTEFEYLIKTGAIKQYHGKLLDVVVTNGKSKRKTRYVTDECYEMLKEMK